MCSCTCSFRYYINTVDTSTTGSSAESRASSLAAYCIPTVGILHPFPTHSFADIVSQQFIHNHPPPRLSLPYHRRSQRSRRATAYRNAACRAAASRMGPRFNIRPSPVCPPEHCLALTMRFVWVNAQEIDAPSRIWRGLLTTNAMKSISNLVFPSYHQLMFPPQFRPF